MKTTFLLVVLITPGTLFAQWITNGTSYSSGSVNIDGSFQSNANYGLVLNPASGDAVIRRTSNGNLFLSSGGGSSEIRFNYNYGGGSGGIHIFDGGTINQSSFIVNSSGNLNISSSGGNVGIGTSSPNFKLDVAGNLRTTSFISANEYITVQNGGTYVVALNGQTDGYVTGRNASFQDKFLISSNGHSYFNGGNVGVGTSSPYYTLDVVGTLRTSDQISAAQYITVNKNGSYRVALNGQSDGYIVGRNDAVQDKFVISSNGTSYFNGGNVGIGTSSPDTKLTVKGTIHTHEVRVDAAANVVPDYVFEKNYNLLPLSEVEAYVNQNKHLPEVPSAKEMEEKGLNLKEMNLLLLKKVEELTLHIIHLEKRSKILEIEVEALKNKQ